MIDESEQTKKLHHLKATTKDTFRIQFQNIEKTTGKSIPKEFTAMVDGAIEDITPSNEAEAIEFIKEFPIMLKEYLSFFENASDGLAPECKDLIEKMVEDLFKVTDGKGIENRLWKHFPNIWSFLRVVRGMDSSKTTPESLDAALFQIEFLYVTLYELTIQMLTEFAVAIAGKKRGYDREAVHFLNQYSKELGKGHTISKGELIRFFKKEKYLSFKPCSILEDSKFRDKPSHADIYYDAENRKIVLGKEVFEVQEFRKLFEEMLKFYCYLIWIYLKNTKLPEFLDQIEEIGKKLPQTNTEKVRH